MSDNVLSDVNSTFNEGGLDDLEQGIQKREEESKQTSTSSTSKMSHAPLPYDEQSVLGRYVYA